MKKAAAVIRSGFYYVYLFLFCDTISSNKGYTACHKFIQKLGVIYRPSAHIKPAVDTFFYHLRGL